MRKNSLAGQSRSEADQSADTIKPAPKQLQEIRDSIPDPEVSAQVGRRRFSAAYKARIVREADACTEPGELGSLLRREGLYSSHLAKWRQQYRAGAEAALEDDKRGRKPTKNPLEDECERLRKELERTQRKLKQAETIIEFQKNLSEMLGISPTSIESEGE
jgi:transposase-like protein